jgi:hypothetical protein
MDWWNKCEKNQSVDENFNTQQIVRDYVDYVEYFRIIKPYSSLDISVTQ